MTEIQQHITHIRATLPESVAMVCVSKFHPTEAIMQAYDMGERDFGESRVQELLPKHQALPKDIRWHFIGHLQTNKVKQILPFVHLIHSVDSIKLLEVINREAEKIQRRVKVLLEVHVAKEETKSGFTPDEVKKIIGSPSALADTYTWVDVCGVMGMATNTEDTSEWRRCFRDIKQLACHPTADIVSMGMSDDYLIAIEEGSNMVRIGSTIFGERTY